LLQNADIGCYSGENGQFLPTFNRVLLLSFSLNFYNQQLAQISPQDSLSFSRRSTAAPHAELCKFSTPKIETKSSSLNQTEAFYTTDLTICRIHVTRSYAEIVISFKYQKGLFLGSKLLRAVSFLISPYILYLLYGAESFLRS
jgi:hypothetical protein